MTGRLFSGGCLIFVWDVQGCLACAPEALNDLRPLPTRKNVVEKKMKSKKLKSKKIEFTKLRSKIFESTFLRWTIFEMGSNFSEVENLYFLHLVFY